MVVGPEAGLIARGVVVAVVVISLCDRFRGMVGRCRSYPGKITRRVRQPRRQAAFDYAKNLPLCPGLAVLVVVPLCCRGSEVIANFFKL